MRVSVIIPTYNEARAIGRVLGDLPGALVSEIVVVDGGSTDGTPEIAARFGARVVVEPQRGYGRACLTGLAHVTSPDVVVFLDGDYSDQPGDLSRLLEPLERCQADLVIGSRLAGTREAGALPWHSLLGNWLVAWLLRVLYRVDLTDPGPFRAARFEVLKALALTETTYGWPVEMIAKGARGGYRIVEVPVSYRKRIGQSKITGTVRGSAGAAWGMLAAVAKYRAARLPSRAATPDGRFGGRHG